VIAKDNTRYEGKEIFIFFLWHKRKFKFENKFSSVTPQPRGRAREGELQFALKPSIEQNTLEAPVIATLRSNLPSLHELKQFVGKRMLADESLDEAPLLGRSPSSDSSIDELDSGVR
jgi:hypothetical protein